MRRREFIALVGGATFVWPLAASAQMQPKIPRVGLVLASTRASKHLLEAFRQALRELGHVEGKQSYWNSAGPRDAQSECPN